MMITDACLVCERSAGIVGQEATHALAAGINLMLWHDVTSGICQLQVCFAHGAVPS